ncbi:MAG: ABC transporter permease [Microthrixaceae bacterium]|nr:ABC transporter permease [Microthrixaceae bacterium]
MAFRVDYLARETGQNLVRNPLPTIAAITTVGVALTMLAVSFLARTGINEAFSLWNNDVSFIVYVKPEASADQIAALRRAIDESPQVDEFHYSDHEESFRTFKRLFEDDPDITQSLKAEDLPTSFRVKPKNPDAAIVEKVAQSFAAKPGVYKVDFVADAVRAVQRIGGRLQAFLLVGSIVLAVASVLLIFNTIQTAIFARRREIEVMRLVGASNWYIRIPFVLEGLVQGFAGALFATGSAWIFSSVWRNSFTGKTTATLFDSIKWSNGQFVTIIALVGGLGTLVSGIVAMISTTWYLRD